MEHLDNGFVHANTTWDGLDARVFLGPVDFSG